MSDEVESIFRQASGDAKNGSGRGETQLLELFDGYGHTTIRMSRDTTSYKRCAVSLIGGIQPDKLRELIDPRDVTGQMARCLFLSLPDTLITPSLKGFTQAELRRQEEARLMLSAFAKHVYDLPKAAPVAEVAWDLAGGLLYRGQLRTRHRLQRDLLVTGSHMAMEEAQRLAA